MNFPLALARKIGYAEKGPFAPENAKGEREVLTWLASNLGTVLVAAILIAAVVLIVISMVRKKKKGGSSCACGCETCRYAGSCRDKKS